MAAQTIQEKTIRYVRQNRIVRPRDLESSGIPREYLLRLHRQGKLVRSGRGIYTFLDAAITELHAYATYAEKGAIFILWTGDMHRPTRDLDLLGRGSLASSDCW